MVQSQMENIVLQIKGIVEKGLGHLIITSSSSHFFKQPISSSISIRMDSVVYWKDSSFQQINQNCFRIGSYQ